MAVAQKAKTQSRAAEKLKTAPKSKVMASKTLGGKAVPQPAKPPVIEAKSQIDAAKAALKKASSTAPKAKGKGRKISVAVSPGEASAQLAQKWNVLYKKAEQIESKPYNMRGVFEEKTAIIHKLLGWGYILANRNDRLEVLFKDGIKHLISNYKS